MAAAGRASEETVVATATATAIEICGVRASIASPTSVHNALARRIRGPRGEVSGAVDVEYTITTDADGLRGLERGQGGIRHHVPDESVVEALAVDLAEIVHRRRPDVVVARGGAVSVDGRGVVVLGPPEGTASGLIDELVAVGAELLSAGLIVFDRTGRVHPVVETDETDVAADHGSGPPRPVPVTVIVDPDARADGAGDPVEVRGSRAVLALLGRVLPNQQRSPSARALLANLAPHVLELRDAGPPSATLADAIIDRVRREPVPVLPELDEPAAASVDDEGAPVVYRRARHLEFDDFLGADEHRRLLDHALARESYFEPSGVLTAEDVDDPVQLRRSRTSYDLGEVGDHFEERLVSLLPSIRRELGIDWFPFGSVERQLTVHGDGDHFTQHIDDAGPDVARRMVSAVYYFNRQPRAFSGGELRLFDTVDVAGRLEPADTCTEVVPTDNTLVVFPSDVPHEVRPVHVPGDAFADRRFTIVCWALRAPTLAELLTSGDDDHADRQLELLPELTDDGFCVVSTPASAQARLRAAFDAGAASAPLETPDASYLPTGTPSMIDLGDLAATLHDELRPVHEQWYGGPLEPTAAYGLRVYREGQTLARHADRYETHVISSVVHVAADVDEPWPLVLDDSRGEQHDVHLEPGQMLLYEGARLPHGRPRPLRGRHHASLFLHYRPLDWSRRLMQAARTAGTGR